MPKREDLKKILIIGSGPIVISQACEFDYSGVQACKALKEEGYEIVLINSNPATIMTDPEMADKTYIEPVTAEVVSRIIEMERPDAILPTLGGQTGLNVSVEVAAMGVLERCGVEMIGATPEVIHKAEDREKFCKAMEHIGLRVPASGFARNMDEAFSVADRIGYPIIIRPSFTLGGIGGGIAYNPEDLERFAREGIDASMIGEIMLEESVIGWKEYELEVMRDKADNVVIICSIENMDPMGVHTGDSITVAPAQTLSDIEYQKLRNASIAVMREIGVETGGSNVQFAVNPENGDIVVIEMNPRVSRSSALASKATGFPIAKIAAKLAVGYTLDEIPNDITRETFASFEPTIDYCVVKIPRWTFEKFPETEDLLTTSMKSVGETMSIGRTFKEALNKAVRSLETGRFGLTDPFGPPLIENKKDVISKLTFPHSLRLFWIAEAIRFGVSIQDVHSMTKIDPWFLHQIRDIVDFEDLLSRSEPDTENLEQAKRLGISDRQLARLWRLDERKIRSLRHHKGILPVYKLVDTCAAEFEAYTPYYYSTYETQTETRVSDKPSVLIIGGGPNRIGQGIEFDYCCVHASFALREMGYESIMINSNPETVSTDYDISDKLFFEPLTLEDVLHVVRSERPEGVIVQFGGQTPLNLAKDLLAEGVNILGTPPEAIDRAEDRERFAEIVTKLGLKQPISDTVTTMDKALQVAREIGFPVLVRPSFVLGGRSMEIIYDMETMESFMETVFRIFPDNPILIDKFLEDAIEVDVDAISDGSMTVIGGIMEHIEEAGIHSGDSACVLPPMTLSQEMLDTLQKQTRLIAQELGVVGLMNIQYAVKDGELYVLEVNPRASRTVPFVSKAIGVPLAQLATKIMLGSSLEDLGFTKQIRPEYISVKEAVFPFKRFPNINIALGPEMKSTGEVMGIDSSFGAAFAKAQAAAGAGLPLAGTVFISVHDAHKDRIVPVAKSFADLGFNIVATQGTADYLRANALKAGTVMKVGEGRPNVVDHIKNREIHMIINTSIGRRPSAAAYHIRKSAIAYNIPYATTIAASRATVEAIRTVQAGSFAIVALQDHYGKK
ncbi:MAG: carbamoyl-phosphate synthase large subunit [Deltaproteobacteria bacterium]|nr:carbamoyl-phosphate synthase large subunit [Deltaproteobacteria bacterium]